MHRRDMLKSSVVAGTGSFLASRSAASQSTTAPQPDRNDRAYWLATLHRVCHPVLSALQAGKLHALMPVEAAPGQEADRRKVTHLEALGRTLAGIAPWLEHGETAGAEGKLLAGYRELARASIAAAVDPDFPDCMNFSAGNQNIVDASFLALAMLRAPRQLQQQLPAKVRSQLAQALRATRVLTPNFNNWLLFTAIIEACLLALNEDWDRLRIDYALREHAAWYLGDGIYGDGPHLHWDYYNSFVIHPYLLQLLDAVASRQSEWSAMETHIRTRARRYAAIQERLINADGSYPIVGRSIAYRCGAFHLLADVTLRQSLPEGISPEQVRCALSAVIRSTLDAPGTFDENGWLRIGLAGHQPALGETYISTGSLYLCTAAFLPLGLPASNPFWANPPRPWTAQQLWQGQNLPADHAIDD